MFPEKCGLGGESSGGVGPELVAFPSTTSQPLIYREAVLAEFGDVTEACRHKLTAHLECKVVSAEFQWGKLTSNTNSNYYPRKFRLRDHSNQPVLCQGDEDVSYHISTSWIALIVG